MAIGYLVRTGAGIADVAWKANPVAGDKLFISSKQWVTSASGGTYNALYRFGGGTNDIRYQNITLGKLLSTYSVGSIVKIKENGTLQPFLVLSHSYPASGRTLVLRKMSYQEIQWGENTDDYSNSNIDSWLNSTYLNVIDSAVRSKITGVNIQTHNYREYSQTGPAFEAPKINISRKVFLLSSTEYGFNYDERINEGTHIPYFDSASKRATGAGQFDPGSSFWTRQCLYSDLSAVIQIRWDGEKTYSADKDRTNFGARPAFTLPSNIPVNESTGEVIG